MAVRVKDSARPDTAGRGIAAAPDATGQLFHLGEDPGESTNLFFEKSEKRTELQVLLRELKKSGRSAPRGRRPIGIENIPAVTGESKGKNR